MANTTKTEMENKSRSDNAKDERITELENELSEMKNLLKQLTNSINNTQVESYNLNRENDNKVIIIATTPDQIKCQFKTWTFNSSRLGQKIPITIDQFYELVNSHRKYFERQYIAVDARYVNIAAEVGLDVYDENSKSVIKFEDLDRIGHMSVREIEDYYTTLSEPMRRIFVNYFMNKCNEKDPDYFIVEKMTLINSLTKTHLFDLHIKLCLSEQAQDVEV